ncbi:MAG: beta-propeller domain-containing protein, partial [Acidimicrobiia bacterium]|nr:beta-propeller domain-containing protein [Acidimicrobiia bacterium]
PIEGDGGIGGPATGADVATTTAIPAPIVASGPIVSGGGSTGVITPPPDYCYTVPADIYRTVVIGDELYTVSTAGVGVHRFHGSLSEVAWIPFT